ncbi:hypothetical protein DK926_17510 [Rhodococcus sp. Eu-32]|uniref:hypothetical protein n=1 Tax=Rhodococcus sp. Eu-32 TaxID=1017319 RepID=UPI000DF1883C|nr:hypothetical protein [Rhodococcus sp. Eu-32]RRQ26598.1 hypothetical protein DK926_17510 [Rhodococcus sp. Eu-32]
MDDEVIWWEESDRDSWWRQVLGLGTEVRECPEADALEQALAVPFEEDPFPLTPRSSVMV